METVSQHLWFQLWDFAYAQRRMGQRPGQPSSSRGPSLTVDFSHLHTCAQASPCSRSTSSSPPLLGKAQLRFLSSMALAPEILSFRIPIALTSDSAPSSRARFSLPVLPGFQAFSCTCHVLQLVADSAVQAASLPLLPGPWTERVLDKCWRTVRKRKHPNHSPLCKIPR